MMSGLRSHFEKMMTCVSERSGSASTAMCCTLQTPIATSTPTTMTTMTLLVAHQRMMRSITGHLENQKPHFENQKPESRNQSVHRFALAFLIKVTRMAVSCD